MNVPYRTVPFSVLPDVYTQGSHASWNVLDFLENSRAWSVLENHFGQICRVTTGAGKSWNLGRPVSRTGMSWKTAKVMENNQHNVMDFMEFLQLC